ncbi:MAG TPA: hypothetical protein VFJ17_08700 [Mycobacteriales bacterium]|nr:hypothetical protein [Mycobacteriales bacterium]
MNVRHSVPALLCLVLTLSCSGTPARVAAPTGKISSTPAATSGSASPTAGPHREPAVTLAYFRPGLGVVGVSPDCCGNQGTGGARLWLTTDMHRWLDVTPPNSGRGRLPGEHPIFEDASFVDASTGWVSTWDVGDLSVVVYRTRDAGRHWSRRRAGGHGAHAGATARFQLLSPSTAYRQELDPAGPVVHLSITRDSGGHWTTVYDGWTRQKRGHPFGPFERPVTFVSAEHGFAADVVSLPDFPYETTGQLFETSDGGRTWSTMRPPLAGGSPCERGRAPTCVLGLPTFFDGSNGVLPGAGRRGARTTISFDRTTDAGATWSIASSLTLPDEGAGTSRCAVTCTLTSIAAPSDWWLLSRVSGGYATWRTTDAGIRWTHHAATLPAADRAVSLWALTPSLAWAVTEVRVPSGTTTQLMRSVDGGTTWRRVVPAAG